MPVLEWTAGQTDLVELMYGLYLTGASNHGKAELKQMAQWVEKNLKVKLGNFYVTWQEISRRKRGRCKFTHNMRDSLDRKMDEMND